MKKFKLLLLSIFVISLLVSCEKKNDEILPSNFQLPVFNESNSTKVSWDNLPAKIKDALLRQDKEIKLKSGSNTFTTLGPWGHNANDLFDHQPLPDTKIYAMLFRSNFFIDRFTVLYERPDGTIYVGVDVGGEGGHGGTLYYLQPFADSEYVTAIEGRSGNCIDQLSFTTNYKKFTYGGTGGTAFQASVPDGFQILGFFGASSNVLCKIGCWVYTHE